MRKISLNGINIDIKKKRVKNFNLRVKSNFDIILSVPVQATDAQVDHFIKSKEEWIIEKIDYFKSQNIIQVQYKDGEPILFLGKKYTLKVIESSKNECLIEDDMIYLYVKDINDYSLKDSVVSEFYKNKAKNLLEDILEDTLNKFKENKNIKLYIRKMKSIWGSCNRYKNKITLNSRLMMQSKFFIEYVIAHEVAHLKHMNHSKEFYNWLSKNMPDWKERRESQIQIYL